ncbi:Branched-chain amino acid aminotransferase 1 mitochondrial [Bienertia sinuspersici]
MKAMRRQDGRIVLFRPDENALCMKIGAKRMCMPSPSVDQFINAVKQIALANKRWTFVTTNWTSRRCVPAPECTFLIYAYPVRNYFKEGSGALNLCVEDQLDRASHNVLVGLKPLARAKSKGFSDVLYLDSVCGKYVEEVSNCNVFIVKVRSSQELLGKASLNLLVIWVLRLRNSKLLWRKCLKVEYRTTDTNSVSKRLLSMYVGIQNGQVEDKKGWLVEINM